MPKTVVTFRSSKFNTTETKDHYINPENYGDDAAKWIAQRLEGLGLSIEKEEEFPGQEDFGWYIVFNQGDDKYCLVIGHRWDDNDQVEWIGWMERHCGFLGSLLGGRKKNISQEVVENVHKALSGSNDVTDIRWHNPKEFDAGQEDNATPQP